MIEVFGWAAAALGVGSSVPQFVRIIRQRTSAGVSLRTWQISAASTAAWAFHGFLVEAPQMQAPNLILCVISLGIVGYILRERRQPALLPLLAIVALAVALGGVELLFGAFVFGTVIVAPQLLAQLTQMRELLRSDDLRGVSLGWLALFLVVQAMWFVFGFVTGDWALIVCAGVMCVTASVNLAVYLVRSRRRAVVLAV